MNTDVIIGITQDALYTMMLVVAPVMLASFVVGIFMSFLQAIFQIHEHTFSFVPKLLAIVMTLVLYAPWMLEIMNSFSSRFLGGFINYLR